MADRELRVVILGDAKSLEASMVGAEAATAKFETRLKNAVVVSGEAGAMSDGLARKMSAMQSLGITPSSAALIGLAGAAGFAVEAAKSMVEISEKNETAQKKLEQAYKSQGLALEDNQSKIDNWLNTNARFIDDQFAAKEAFANLTRAGFDQNVVMHLMNDSLDLAAVKNISLAEASHMLILAEEGNTKALKDLGISQHDVTTIFRQVPTTLKDVQKAQAELEKATDAQSAAIQRLNDWEAIHHDRSKLTIADLIAERDHKQKVADAALALKDANDHLSTATNGVVTSGSAQAELLGVLDPKIKNGRNTTSDLVQSQRDLAASWDRLATQNGPMLVDILAKITGGAASLMKTLNDPKTFKFANDSLLAIAINLREVTGLVPGATGFAGRNNMPWGPKPYDPGYQFYGGMSQPGANNDNRDPSMRDQFAAPQTGTDALVYELYERTQYNRNRGS